MRRQFRRSLAGFSLVETLVALLLVAIMMLAVAPLFLNSTRSNAAAWDFSTLNSLARERLEELMQYNFLDARLTVPFGSTISVPSSTSSTAPPTVAAGAMYLNEVSKNTTDGAITVTTPYQLVYTVQDYLFGNIPTAGAPDPTKATTDADVNWNNQKDVKYLVVYVAVVAPRVGHGNAYNFSPGFTTIPILGAQVRIAAVKAP